MSTWSSAFTDSCSVTDCFHDEQGHQIVVTQGHQIVVTQGHQIVVTQGHQIVVTQGHQIVVTHLLGDPAPLAK